MRCTCRCCCLCSGIVDLVEGFTSQSSKNNHNNKNTAPAKPGLPAHTKLAISGGGCPPHSDRTRASHTAAETAITGTRSSRCACLPPVEVRPIAPLNRSPLVLHTDGRSWSNLTYTFTFLHYKSGAPFLPIYGSIVQ